MPVSPSSFDPFTSSPRHTETSDLLGQQGRITSDSDDDILKSDGQDSRTSASDPVVIATSSPMPVLSTDPIDVTQLPRPRTPQDREEQVEVVCEIVLSPINRNSVRRPRGTARSRRKKPLKDDSAEAKAHKRSKVTSLREAHQWAGSNVAVNQKHQKNNNLRAPDAAITAQLAENQLTAAVLSSESDLKIIDFPSSPPPRSAQLSHTLFEEPVALVYKCI
ncbi:hypothetical protein POJ06DRAFT_95586 [Lipomyces tetrasporus]|uniref:Uncharacterized protein n=1 Tax=Lipomyces tetrasporus TaxID=54092 RepID=A0AAD7QU31_9ASCO|nr:uncharacterized protein POJ06DRAFT_95586 [Lipomyces tetrasporus]KAJ8101369.1 hypothetical protein POJ06DRAFT_95586 [Lipomyces tetrasporus]